MNANEIIRPEEVMAALNGGFEVLHIEKNLENRYGLFCKQLTKEIYEKIEKIIENANDNDIFVKTVIELSEEDQKPSEEPVA